MNLQESVSEVNRRQRGIWWRNVYFSYKDDAGVRRYFFAQIDDLTCEIVWQSKYDYKEEIWCIIMAGEVLRTKSEIPYFGEHRPDDWQQRVFNKDPVNLTPRHWATHPDHPMNYRYRH